MQVNYWIQMDNVLIKLELELKINCSIASESVLFLFLKWTCE